MKNKDEFSMTKLGLKTSNSQQNILSLEYNKITTRNNLLNNIINGRENMHKSLPKLKNKTMTNDKFSESIITRNYNNSNISTFINYCDKKKLSFYKGENISLSSFFLDANKTISTDIKNISNSFTKNIFNTNNNGYPGLRGKKIIDIKNKKNEEKITSKRNLNEIKSTLNPYLDISKLKYKTTITSIRNKYSIFFDKEFELFDKFFPSLYTLKFDHETKFYLNQLHNKVLFSIKFLCGTFLDQDIETFKINESNLEQILTNLLQLFIFNNKIINSLIRHTKKIMVDSNRDKQDKKEIVEENINTQIENLKKKLNNKNNKIKILQNEKFQEHNEYLISVKKLRDEQNDLVKLLQRNKNYFDNYKNSQKEIKEKNNIIIQQKIDYNDMVDKNNFDKTKLEDDIIELKETIKPIQEENELIINKNKDLEEKLSLVNEIMKKKNEIIIRLQENLMMKEEELLNYINEIDIIKGQNDKLSYNLIALKKKYNSLSNKEFGFNQFEYNNKIKED